MGERDDRHRRAPAGLTCKLSGLVTEAPADAGLETLRPYIAALLERFGPRRLLWGSDWPVVDLAGGYDRWHGLAREALSGLDAGVRADVFGGNAARVYLQCPTGRGALLLGGSERSERGGRYVIPSARARSPRPSSR